MVEQWEHRRLPQRESFLTAAHQNRCDEEAYAEQDDCCWEGDPLPFYGDEGSGVRDCAGDSGVASFKGQFGQGAGNFVRHLV